MKFTPEQVIEMAREAGLSDWFIDNLSDQNAKRIKRLCTLAADRALEAAAVEAEAMHEEDRPGDYAYAIRAMKEHQ